MYKVVDIIKNLERINIDLSSELDSMVSEYQEKRQYQKELENTLSILNSIKERK